MQLSTIRFLAAALALLLGAPSAVRGQGTPRSATPLGARSALDLPAPWADPVVQADDLPVPEPLFAASDRASADVGDSRVLLYTVGGALVGAAVGVAILFAPRNCRSGQSMCGLAIPLYAGAGATAGGLLGYLIGAARP